VTVHREQSVKREKNQQDATIRCLLSTSVSTCFGHHYAHLQESKDRVTAYGVLLWFCWMWLVAVVGALRCRIRAVLFFWCCEILPEERKFLGLLNYVGPVEKLPYSCTCLGYQ
jgi:hypothetical protein